MKHVVYTPKEIRWYGDKAAPKLIPIDDKWEMQTGGTLDFLLDDFEKPIMISTRLLHACINEQSGRGVVKRKPEGYVCGVCHEPVPTWVELTWRLLRDG